MKSSLYFILTITASTYYSQLTNALCITSGGYAFEGTPCVSSCLPYQSPTLPYVTTSHKRPPIQPVKGDGSTWCATVDNPTKLTRKKWGFCNCDSNPTLSPHSNPGCGPKSNEFVCTYVVDEEGCRTASERRARSYDEAAQICLATGGRLCTKAELSATLAQSLCSATGDDSRLVWTKTTCIPSSGKKSPRTRTDTVNTDQDPITYRISMPGDGSGTPVCSNPDIDKMRSSRCCRDLQPQPRNVLLIVLDDMRADMTAAYGRTRPRTPNLDAFARSRGTMVFEKAYCAFPVCSPSRSSFLMGLSPDTTRVYGNAHVIPPQLISMPRFFKNQGFVVSGGGKVFHPGQDYIDQNWVDYYFPNTNPYQWDVGCASTFASKITTRKGDPVVRGQICKLHLDADPSTMLDFELANKAKKTLERLVRYNQPFFLAVGFFLPHLPYAVTDMFWGKNMFQNNDDAEHPQGPVPQSSFDEALSLDPDASLTENGGNTTPWLWSTINPDWRKAVRSAYYAAIAQVDSLVGDILVHLSDLGLEDTTMVVIMGDHGFFVGENGFWNKNVLYELATRTPVMMRVPWIFDNKKIGTVKRSHRVVETLSLYRTIAGLMGIADSVPEYVQGEDLSFHVTSIIGASAPTTTTTVLSPEDLSSMAFSQVIRCGEKMDCFPFGTNYEGPPTNITVGILPPVLAVGYSVRTQKWRYTAFFNTLQGGMMPHVNWSTVIHQELFSHARDDQDLFDYASGVSFAVETENVASSNPKICSDLLQTIKARFVPQTESGFLLI
jgi:iduronate 2-sulfatase